MEKILSVLQATVVILITFGLAVFVHEFGHMIFALLRGVGVESFAIGMGPKITAWKWRGIEFSLRWFPVGGFVKLQGRTPPGSGGYSASVLPEPPASTPSTASTASTPSAGAGEEKSLSESAYDDLYALQDKGLLTKVLVFGGGVFMNFVTATVAIALVLWIGMEIDQYRFVIEKVEPGSVEARAGLQAGDRVVAFNGKPIEFYGDFAKGVSELLDTHTPSSWKRLAAWFGEEKLRQAKTIQFTLTVQRGAARKTIALPPLTEGQINNWPENVALKVPAIVGDVIPSYPAERAGIKVGDRVVAVNGKSVDSFMQMSEIISKYINEPITVTVLRGGQKLTLTMSPRPNVEDPKKGQIGIQNGSEHKRLVRIANPLKAIALAPLEAVDRLGRFLKINVDFFRKASFKQVRENVGGPIAIAAITAHKAKQGLVEAIDWFITLNLLLFIFNLLPLPVLDGGFVLLAFIEAAIRRPVPPRVLGPIYTVFVVGFIVLIVLISVQDVMRWVLRLIP